MEPVEVTARFDTDGGIWPERFIWQGSSLRVEGVGRRWKTEGAWHILVMVVEARVFELVFQPQTGTWWVRVPQRGAAVA